MQDQAHTLRRLVSRVASVEHDSARARQIVFSGCKGGVGTTTMAVNVAIALRKQKHRVLVVDANPSHGDVATLLRLQVSHEVDDMTEGSRTMRQLLVAGPLGIQIVPGVGVRDGAIGARILHLLRQLDSVASQFDWVLIDAGCCPSTAELLWPLADQAIVIGTADFVAITDAYALIKAMTRKRAVSQVASLVNRAPPGLAAEAQQRLTESCRRFLQLDLPAFPGVPECEQVREAENAGRPVLCSHPRSPAAKAMMLVAQQLASAELAPNHFNSMLFA